jgi:hypothetical protein
MLMSYKIQRSDPSLKGCLNLVLKAIFDCYKPMDSEMSYWKSFKDENNVWRKEKVEKTNEDIAIIIEERKRFLTEDPLIKKIDGEVFFNTLCDKRALVKMFDEYLQNGCDNTIYCKLLKAIGNNPMLDD